MLKRFVFLGIFSLCGEVNLFGQLPEGFIQEQIASGLDPTRLVLADDGRIFVAEKNGDIRIIHEGQLLPNPLIQIPVDHLDERGLLGLVLDPSFGSNQFFYVYYTVLGANHNRLSRFKASGNYADIHTEEILMDMDGLWWQVHNGGSMVFGSDGKLYLATGDGANPNGAQNLGTVAGKVLRINPDGTIPEDNPFISMTEGKFQSIYALGLRNPFSMSINPLDNKIFVTDVGNSSFEEINELEIGRNYGWPLIEGPIQQGQSPPLNYKDPVYAYDHSEGCAIVGTSFYSPVLATFPSDYHNMFFFGDYCSNKINVIDPVTGELFETFGQNIEQPVGMMVAPDGALYYISRGGAYGDQAGNSSSEIGAVWRIRYTGGGYPFVFSQPSDVLVSVGENATFAVSASGTGPLGFQWLRDDLELAGETSSTLTIPNTTLADNGSVFVCRVQNDEGEVFSNAAILAVTSNQRPTINFSSPLTGLKYRAGDTIIFKGEAIDPEDGLLENSAISWKIDFHHDAHAHPAVESITGVDSIIFVIPLLGETSVNVWYRAHLTSTDNSGLANAAYIDVYPEKRILEILTNPPGLPVSIDGKSIATPYTVEGVVNLSRTLTATEAIPSDSMLFIFKNWNMESFSGVLDIKFPSSDTTYTAHYQGLPLDDGTGLLSEFFIGSDNFSGSADYVRIDSVIDFNWASGTPVEGKINEDDFSIRWSGFLTVPISEIYTFYLSSDDGSRLWINNQLIVDNWSTNDFTSGKELSGSIFLSSEKVHHIRLEYYENRSLAFIQLKWSSETIPKSIIPKNQFFIDDNSSVTPPTITFNQPSDDFKFSLSDTIAVVVQAIDYWGNLLDAKDAMWTVEQIHDDHFHPFLLATETDTLRFVAEGNNENHQNIIYRITLSIADFLGNRSEISRDFYPSVVNVSLTSNVSGLTFNFGGKEILSGENVDEVLGQGLTVQVPGKIFSGDTTYVFNGWSEGYGSDSVVVVNVTEGMTMTALYNAIPLGNIISHAGDFKFGENQTISMSAYFFDIEDGSIPSNQLIWKVDLHHKSKKKPLIESTTDIDTLSFENSTALNLGFDYFYRVYVTGSDLQGGVSTVIRDFIPNVVKVTLTSDPAGIPMKKEGENNSISEFFALEGSRHSVAAPSEVRFGDVAYEFLEWSNESKEEIILIEVPAMDTTLVAKYSVIAEVHSNFDKPFPFFYPNPTESSITIVWGEAWPGAKRVDILGATGQSLMNFVGSGSEVQEMDISSLAKGMYVLRLGNDNAIRFFKLIKK